MGSSDRPYWPRRSILFTRQNYHNQSIGSALRASPFISFCAFARIYYPNVGSAFRALQMLQPPIFRRFDVRLAVSDMLRSTPTTPSVNLHLKWCKFSPLKRCKFTPFLKAWIYTFWGAASATSHLHLFRCTMTPFGFILKVYSNTFKACAIHLFWCTLGVTVHQHWNRVP